MQLTNNKKDTNKDIKDEELPTQKDEVIDIKIEANEFDITDCQYNIDDEITEKELKYLEHQIRESYEYKQYIQYLKTELDLNKCELMPGLDPKTDPVSIELHHFPITLYDITETIVRKQLSELDEGDSISSFDISEEVMKEHYENHIGLVPLTTTLHEMAHSGSIQIPHKMINGNYSDFVEKYKEFMTLDALARLEDNVAASKNPDALKKNKEKLEKKILHYDIEYKDNDIFNPDDLKFFDDKE